MDNPDPPPAPGSAPEPTQQAKGDAPAASSNADMSFLDILAAAKKFFARQPAPAATGDAPGKAPPPRWFRLLALVLRLVWPLAMLGGGIALFIVFGPCGWLWLVLGVLVVCGVFARPPELPFE